jgi:ATP-binding cassette subfamily F protein uup
MALESLPTEIDELEEKIDKTNICLADPKCYEERGIAVIAQELATLEELYELKVEELLTIQEKEEEINTQ